jgi:hypothetical protein
MRVSTALLHDRERHPPRRTFRFAGDALPPPSPEQRRTGAAAPHVAPAREEPAAGDGDAKGDVLNQLPVSIWTTDLELRYTSVSGRPLPGVNPELGVPVHDSFDPRARPIGALRAHQQALAGASGTFEHEIDGRIYRCEVSPWKDGGHRIAGTLAVGIDITEHKHGKVRLVRRSPRAPAVADADGRAGEDLPRAGAHGALPRADLQPEDARGVTLRGAAPDAGRERRADPARCVPRHLRELRHDARHRPLGDPAGL